MERPLCAVYRCSTCNLSLDGQEASDEHEKKTGHNVRRTQIIIKPPRMNSSGGFDIKCIMGGAPSGTQQAVRSDIRGAPQTMFVMTNGSQLVRQRVQTLQGNLIAAPPQVTARVGGGRPVFFLASAPGSQVPQQQAPLAAREPVVEEATGEIPQEVATVEREEVVQQEETVQPNGIEGEPEEAAGSSNGNLELLTQAQLDIIKNCAQKPGGGKAPDNKRVLGPMRSNPRNGNRGNGTEGYLDFPQ